MLACFQTRPSFNKKWPQITPKNPIWDPSSQSGGLEHHPALGDPNLLLFGRGLCDGVPDVLEALHHLPKGAGEVPVGIRAGADEEEGVGGVLPRPGGGEEALRHGHRVVAIPLEIGEQRTPTTTAVVFVVSACK